MCLYRSGPTTRRKVQGKLGRLGYYFSKTERTGTAAAYNELSFEASFSRSYNSRSSAGAAARQGIAAEAAQLYLEAFDTVVRAFNERGACGWDFFEEEVLRPPVVLEGSGAR